MRVLPPPLTREEKRTLIQIEPPELAYRETLEKLPRLNDAARLYAFERAAGRSEYDSFSFVFGFDRSQYVGVYPQVAFEANEVVREYIQEELALAAINKDEVELFAIAKLREIVNSRSEKTTDRLKALDSMLLLLNITFIDENGVTKKKESAKQRFEREFAEAKTMFPWLNLEQSDGKSAH